MAVLTLDQIKAIMAGWSDRKSSGPFAGVTFDGPSGTTLASFGGTLVKDAVGRFTFTFTSPRPDNKYYVVGNCGRSITAEPSGGSTILIGVLDRTTTYVKFNTVYANGNLYDGEEGSLLCFPSSLVG
jgi:hypothetical protein